MSISVSFINGHTDKTRNFERIKAMNPAELAEFLYNIRDDTPPDFEDGRVDKIIDGIDFINCSPKAIQMWLESEVDEEC